VLRILSDKGGNTSFDKRWSWEEMNSPIGRAGNISGGEIFSQGSTYFSQNAGKNETLPLEL
jgi:hypothetical protein